MLRQIDQEEAFERDKAFFEATERASYRRAGTIAAMILNVNRGDKDAKLWEAADFFPQLKFNADGTPIEETKPQEMDTAQTVDYLKRGFGLLVPTSFRQKVGLPD